MNTLTSAMLIIWEVKSVRIQGCCFTLWNNVSLGAKLVPSLTVFHRAVNTELFHWSLRAISNKILLGTCSLCNLIWKLFLKKLLLFNFCVLHSVVEWSCAFMIVQMSELDWTCIVLQWMIRKRDLEEIK